MKGWSMYRHRPTEVEAIRVGEAPWRDVAEWCSGSVIRDGRKNSFIYVSGSKAYEGDYIFLDGRGLFRVSTATSFESAFQPVTSNKDRSGEPS